MSALRYAALFDVVARYKALAAENYSRIRELADRIRSGYCAYLSSEPAPCVLLVPPSGAFQPISYEDKAFSTPATGFQVLGPITFGLAVRVSEAGDWLRVALTCRKEGEAFEVRLEGGDAFVFDLPLNEAQLREFFDLLYSHLTGWFARAIEAYESGEYGQRSIGFEFFQPTA